MGQIKTNAIKNAAVTDPKVNASGINIAKVNGSASTVKARYVSTAGQSIVNGTISIVDFGTVDFDANSTVTTGAAWKFTAPAAADYAIDALVRFAPATFQGAGAVERLYLYKNGVYERDLDSFIQPNLGFTQKGPTLKASTTIPLLAGDYIDIRVSHLETTARSLDANTGSVWIEIYQRTNVFGNTFTINPSIVGASMSGFVPVYNSATSIGIGPGLARDISGTYDVLFTTTQNVTLTSPVASTSYYCWARRDNTLGTYDWYYDTSAIGANVAPGYTIMRMLFAFRTDASGNIINFTARETNGGGLYVQFATEIVVATTLLTTAATPSILNLPQPATIASLAMIRVYATRGGGGGSANNTTIFVWSPFTVTAPTVPTASEFQDDSSHRDTNTVEYLVDGTLKAYCPSNGGLSIVSTGYQLFRVGT